METTRGVAEEPTSILTLTFIPHVKRVGKAKSERYQGFSLISHNKDRSHCEIMLW